MTVVFLGDGTLGQGVVYEALNMAALWRLPVLYVLENNHIAQTTPQALALAGDMLARFQAFGIPARQLDSSDVLKILPLAGQLLADVRAQCAPRGLVLHTYRFGPHSKGDDTRPAEVVAALRRQRDPLEIHGRRLDEQKRQTIEHAVAGEVRQAFEQALADELPVLTSVSEK